MNCITLTQPYATLMSIGAKKNETRSWPLPIKHRGQTFGIHAGKGFGYFGSKAAYIEESTANEYIYAALEEAKLVPFTWSAEALLALPFGALVATVQFVDCVHIARIDDHGAVCLVIGQSVWRNEPVQYFVSEAEYNFGDYGLGRYVWVSNTLQALEPQPAKGRQGIWTYNGPPITSISKGKPSTTELTPS